MLSQMFVMCLKAKWTADLSIARDQKTRKKQVDARPGDRCDTRHS